jgi:hypothetical protein
MMPHDHATHGDTIEGSRNPAGLYHFNNPGTVDEAMHSQDRRGPSVHVAHDGNLGTPLVSPMGNGSLEAFIDFNSSGRPYHRFADGFGAGFEPHGHDFSPAIGICCQLIHYRIHGSDLSIAGAYLDIGSQATPPADDALCSGTTMTDYGGYNKSHDGELLTIFLWRIVWLILLFQRRPLSGYDRAIFVSVGSRTLGV